MVKAFRWIGAVVLVALAFLLWKGVGAPVEREVEIAPLSEEVPAESRLETSLAKSPGESAEAATGRSAVETAPAPASTEPGENPRDADQQLVLRARVLDPLGGPIEGATMTAVYVRGRPAAAAGEDGWARLVLDWPMHLTEGNDSWAVVEVTGEGLTRVKRQERVDGPGEVLFGEIRLAKAGSITGRVLDHDGTPSERAGVWLVQGVEPGEPAVEDLRRTGAGGFSGIEVFLGTESDVDGRYTITGVPLSRVSVVCQARGRYCAYTPPIQILEGMTVNAPDLHLQLPGEANTIRGVVRDADGIPVSGTCIEVWENRGPRNVEPEASTWSSGPEARFEVMVPANRLFTLEARDPDGSGLFLLAHDVASGSQDVVLTFPAERTFEIHVTDTEGRPVERPYASLADEGRYGMSIRSEQLGDGKLSLNLPAVPFQIWVGGPGFETKWLGQFEPQDVPEILDVQLERAPVLSGRVVADGKPVAGARVHCHVPPGWSRFARFSGGLYTRIEGRSVRGMAQTDEAGHFEIPIQQANTSYTLHAEAPGYARAESEPIPVGAGESVSGILLELPAPATLAGRALVSPGVESRGIIVAATRGDGHAELAVTAEDGSFRFEGLAPGGWQLARVKASERRWIESDRTWPENDIDELPIHVVLTSGITTHFDLDLTHEFQATLRGHLAIGGAPAAAWRLWMEDLQNESSRTTLDDAGRFQLQVLSTGSTRLFFTSPQLSAGTLTLRAKVTLEAGENVWNLDAAAGELSIDGLLPTGDIGGDMPQHGYELRWEAGEDGGQWRLAFDPDPNGGLHATGLPVGSVTLVRRVATDYRGHPQEIGGQSFAITAGGSTSVTFSEE